MRSLSPSLPSNDLGVISVQRMMEGCPVRSRSSSVVSSGGRYRSGEAGRPPRPYMRGCLLLYNQFRHNHFREGCDVMGVSATMPNKDIRLERETGCLDGCHKLTILRHFWLCRRESHRAADKSCCEAETLDGGRGASEGKGSETAPTHCLRPMIGIRRHCQKHHCFDLRVGVKIMSKKRIGFSESIQKRGLCPPKRTRFRRSEQDGQLEVRWVTTIGRI